MAAGTVGGAETLTKTLLKGMSPQSCLLITQRAIADLFDDIGHPVLVFDDWGLSTPYGMDPRNAVAYARVITEVVTRYRIDVVHGLMHNATVFLAAAKLLSPWRLRSVRLIGSIHGSLMAYFAHERRGPTLYERFLVRTVFRLVDGVVVPSAALADELSQQFGVNERDLRPIHNGFDLAWIRRQAQQPLEAKKDRPWIVTCCRLTAQKDFNTLLGAFALVCASRDVELVIVGDGEDRNVIEARSTALGVEARVRLIGYQPNPYPWIARADVFVLSSHYEGFGNVLVEAMALGVPVVSSDCPSGPGEIIEQDRSGVLVPPGSVEAMAERIGCLLDDATIAGQMAQSALQRAERFDVAAMVQAYSDYLRLTDPPQAFQQDSS